MEPSPLFIITGETHSGKSTYLRGLVSSLQEGELPVYGWTAPAVFMKGHFAGYDLLFIPTGKQIPFCRMQAENDWLQLGRFWYNPSGLALGRECIEEAPREPLPLIVIDEIGPFELDGKLWGPLIGKLAVSENLPLLLVVREKMLDRVIGRWGLHPTGLINTDPGQERNRDHFKNLILKHVLGDTGRRE